MTDAEIKQMVQSEVAARVEPMVLAAVAAIKKDVMEQAAGMQAADVLNFINNAFEKLSITGGPNVRVMGRKFDWQVGAEAPAQQQAVPVRVKTSPTKRRGFEVYKSGATTVQIWPDTILGQYAGAMNSFTPVELTPTNGDTVYVHLTLDGTGTITNSEFASAASMPANDYEAGKYYWNLAIVYSIDNIVQTRWGPIEVFPPSAVSNYYMTTGANDTAQVDYWDLLSAVRGQQQDSSDIMPTYDSIQTLSMGLARFYKVGDALKIFVRPITINSIGQITYIGPEQKVFDEAVVN